MLQPPGLDQRAAATAMALDGALDRALSESVMLADEARAAERAFTRAGGLVREERSLRPARAPQACVVRHAQPVLRVWSRLIADANRSPIPTPGVPDGITEGDIHSATDENYLLFKPPNAFTPLN